MEGRSEYRRNTVPVEGEVRLRQLSVEEAMLKLDKYLDSAFMAGLCRIRVVHGKGTGTLRRLARERLVAHPLVKSFRPGGYEEGGAGVTIVEMESRQA